MIVASSNPSGTALSRRQLYPFLFEEVVNIPLHMLDGSCLEMLNRQQPTIDIVV